jgi:hypothetical protein
MISGADEILLRKAAEDSGFGIDLGRRGAWLAFAGPAPIRLLLTMRDGYPLLAIDHPGVARELPAERTVFETPPGFAAFLAPDREALWSLVGAARRLALALPTAPLDEWRRRTAHLGDTEAERVEKVRIGQDVFRERLMDYWNGRCPISGVTHPRLLRASHIIPWADCESDADRLDVHNGLLLAAHLDAAFDAHLLSFDNDGSVVLSPALSAVDRTALGIPPGFQLSPLTAQHKCRLNQHIAQLETRSLIEIDERVDKICK